MDIDTKLQIAIYTQLFVAGAVLLAINLVSPSQLEEYRLWEIFPAVLASIITTFGLRHMKELT